MHEIGPQLRAAREAREISLEVAEEETKIRKKYLEALEAGTPDVIPGDVYARGFLRSYANWLGLDGNQVLERYKERQSGPGDSPQAESTPGVARPPATPAAERPAVTATRKARHKPGLAGLPFILAGGVLVVAIVGYLLARQFGTKSAPPPTPTPATQGTAGAGTGATPIGAPGTGGNVATGSGTAGNNGNTGAGTASGSPGTTATGTPASTNGADKVAMRGPNGETVLFDLPGTGPIDVALQFAANSKVWMRVTVDGKAVFEGNSTSNAHWTGKSVTIRLGNADGLQGIVVNGQSFERPLKGGPFTLTFAPKA